MALTAAVIVLGLGIGLHGNPRSAVGSPGASATADGQPRLGDGRPNIVFVLTDDLSTDLLPYMQNVQALRARGLSFSHYFVTNSLCCPSRSSILTGGYPHTTHVLTNGGPTGGYREFQYRGGDRQTFATSLQEAGYTTALIGKYLNGYFVSSAREAPSEAIGPGWDEWYVAGGHDGYAGFDYTLNENGFLVRYGKDPADYITDVLSEKAVDFVNRQAATGKPLLLEVSTFAPHSPYTPAPRDARRYPGLTYPRTPAYDYAGANAPSWLAGLPPLPDATKASLDNVFRARAQAVHSVDDLVGALTEALRAKGMLDDTYFVFSSDNGYHLGEHRLHAGKMTAFDTDIRVPLIVAGPGVPEGAVTDALSANIDLCPTFIELGGGRPTSLVDGRSLVPLLRGESQTPRRRAVLIEQRRPSTNAQIGPDERMRSEWPPTYEAIRLQDAVYVEYADGEREYYDIAADPHELHNLAPQLGTDRLAVLSRSVAALKACRGTQECDRASQAAGAALVGQAHPK